MTHQVTVPAMVAIGLAACLASCGDAPGPVGLAAPPPALASRGGAPHPADIPPRLNEFGSFVCGFPVYEAFAGREKVLELPGGRTILVYPGLRATFSNGNTGESVTLSSTGSVHVNPLPDGGTELVLVGRNPVGFDVDGEFFFLMVSGRFTILFGPDGALVRQLDGNGQRLDLCALLS